MSGVGRAGRRRVYFFWCDPLTAAVRIVMCAVIIFAARRWVPGAVEAFMRLDPVAQGRAAALAVIVAALAWLINGAASIMIRRPVPPAPADGERRRFERWVDAQPEAGRDRVPGPGPYRRAGPGPPRGRPRRRRPRPGPYRDLCRHPSRGGPQWARRVRPAPALARNGARPVG